MYPDYFFSSGYDLLPFFMILSILAIFFLFFLLSLAILSYIFSSLALYTMAKNRHFKHSWLAWVPGASRYIHGGLIGDGVLIGSWYIPWASLFLPLSGFALIFLNSALGAIPFMGWFLLILVNIAVLVYGYCGLYRLYKIYAGHNAVLYTVLSIVPVTAIAAPFFLFAIRNNPADFSQVRIDPPKAKPWGSYDILALASGILTLFTAPYGNAFWTGAMAILFAILAFQELRVTHRSYTLALLGLIFGILGILLNFILPALISTFMDSTVFSPFLNQYDDYTPHHPDLFDIMDGHYI